MEVNWIPKALRSTCVHIQYIHVLNVYEHVRTQVCQDACLCSGESVCCHSIDAVDSQLVLVAESLTGRESAFVFPLLEVGDCTNSLMSCHLSSMYERTNRALR